MGSCEEYRNEGWYISKDGYSLITEDGMVKTRRGILENALNTDIKDFGEPILGNLLKQAKIENVVLQIQKIRNVAAPKSKEESQVAPRMLKLILTDGHTNCQGIEILNVSSLSYAHTPPGSKILIKNAEVFSNCILLHSNCCSLLGGRVPVMYEKWEVAKNMLEHVRSSAGSDGPPPWVNFGERIVSLNSNEPFKSLASKVAKETTNEFDVHRQDAIANAASGAVKKVFGGGTKMPQDNQLTTTNLRNKGNNFYNRHNNENQNNQEHSRGGFKNRRENKEKINNEKSQKPTEKVSLFDFLETKLTTNSDSDNKIKIKAVDDNYYMKQDTQRINVQQKEPQKYQNPSAGGFHYQTNSINNFSKPVFISNKNSESNVTINSTPIQNQSRNVAAVTNPIEKVTKNFERVSLNSQFATRSLQQHLNLVKNTDSKPRVNSPNPNQNWKIGDFCLAKYWEDGKFYDAVITNLTESTCVVRFNGYGNVEEVLKTDCLPSRNNSATNNQNYRGNSGYYNRRTFSNNRSYYNNKST